MEKVKIDNLEFEIVGLDKRGKLLSIMFNEIVSLIGLDLSSIEVYTSGGVFCTTLIGFSTIYKGNGTECITLSNDGSVYMEPVEPDPVEPYVPTPEQLLLSTQEKKLVEVSSICQKTIYAGTDIITSKGVQHFSLTLEDQTNISFAYSSIMNGASEFPYHADGELCVMYSSEDILTIANKSTSFKLWNTTYCNHLNIWIKRCGTVEEVNTIHYGVDLPEDLKTNFDTVVGA
jgi:hypothetical protein